MDDYVLTARGKWALGSFITVLVIGMIMSGSYIIDYFNVFSDQNVTNAIDANQPNTKTEVTINSPSSTNENEKNEEIKEIENETPVANEKPTNESSVAPEVIYTEQDLKELKSYIITLHYNSNSDQLTKESETLLEGLLHMLQKYSNESVTIQTYVNGYPNFKSNKENMKISVERGNRVVELFSDKGLATKRFNVYNFGAEVSLYKEEHRQYENDRVNIFFTDHYIVLPAAK